MRLTDMFICVFSSKSCPPCNVIEPFVCRSTPHCTFCLQCTAGTVALVRLYNTAVPAVYLVPLRHSQAEGWSTPGKSLSARHCGSMAADYSHITVSWKWSRWCYIAFTYRHTHRPNHLMTLYIHRWNILDYTTNLNVLDKFDRSLTRSFEVVFIDRTDTNGV